MFRRATTIRRIVRVTTRLVASPFAVRCAPVASAVAAKSVTVRIGSSGKRLLSTAVSSSSKPDYKSHNPQDGQATVDGWWNGDKQHYQVNVHLMAAAKFENPAAAKDYVVELIKKIYPLQPAQAAFVCARLSDGGVAADIRNQGRGGRAGCHVIFDFWSVQRMQPVPDSMGRITGHVLVTDYNSDGPWNYQNNP